MDLHDPDQKDLVVYRVVMLGFYTSSKLKTYGRVS